MGHKKSAVQNLTGLVEDTGCVIVDYPVSVHEIGRSLYSRPAEAADYFFE